MNSIKKYSIYIRSVIIFFAIVFSLYSLVRYTNSTFSQMYVRANNMEMNYTTSVIINKEIEVKQNSLLSGGIFGSGPYTEYNITSQHPDDTKHTFNLNDKTQFESLNIGDTIYLIYNASGNLTAVRKSKDDLDNYIKNIQTYYDDSNLEPVIQEIQYK